MKHPAITVSSARLRKTMIQRISVAALVLPYVACSGPSTPGPPPRPFSGVVYGVVKNGSNVPLGGVQVESEAYRGGCATSAKIGGSSPIITVTDAAGRFRQQIVTADSASEQCIRVIAHPSTGTPVAAETTGLRFKPYGDGSTRDDSIRVDVVVP